MAGIKLLTVDELAVRWSTSCSYLANLRSQGKGCPYIKLNRRVLYRESDVAGYEEARRITVEFVKPKARK